MCETSEWQPRDRENKVSVVGAPSLVGEKSPLRSKPQFDGGTDGASF
jgi:hypothetical protein